MKPRFKPVIRVFVGSTFSDLKEERNVLQREVFPRLEQYCLVRGFQFQAIDLRWGVPGEAGLNHHTMEICFEELRRAQEISPRPNFLVLLGDRYGWQPLAETVTRPEFQQLEEAARQLDDDPSQVSTSSMHVLRTWYRRDDNADPAKYILRSRHEPPDSADYTDNSEGAKWKNVERTLWAVINRAYPPSDLAGRFVHITGPDEPLPSIVKFQASATEQEIWRGALAVPDAKDHVVAWYRTIRNRHQLLGDERARDFFDQEATLHRDVSELKEELSRKLRREGEGGIAPVEVDLLPADNGQRLEITRDHLATMCDQIEKRLVHIIEKEISEYWHSSTALGSATPAVGVVSGANEARKLELERFAHERFGESRAPKELFVGREKELEAITKYLGDENDHKPLVVYGPSGMGKTALLARAAQLAESGSRRVLVRFLGTTPQSSNLRSLLINLCRALRSAEDAEKEVPAELRELQGEFDSRLASATEDEPILIFLDALDQLHEADGARQTYWLRTPLPPHVKVVASCIYDADGEKELNEPYLALARRKLLEGQDGQRRAIAVESLPPEQAMELLDRWLAHGNSSSKQKRKLTHEQRNAIVVRVSPEVATTCRRPLFLRILFEQCRLWPSYKEVKPDDLGENAAALLQGFFERLAQPAIHGRLLVESALSYIASARRGLSENEILEILWADPDYKQHLNTAAVKTNNEPPAEAFRIPIAIWSRLRHDLDPYLAEHAAPGGAVLNFYHREVRRVVKERFLSSPTERVLRHRRMAEYFQSDRQRWWREVDASEQVSDIAAPRRLPNARRASELPWQLLRVAEASDPRSEDPAAWGAPVDVLCDMEFVEAKCAAGLVYELQEDYREAKKLLPEALVELRTEEARRAETARWGKKITEYARQWNERRDRIQRGDRVDETEPILPRIPAACRMWTDEEIEAECCRIREAPTRLDRLATFAGFLESELYPLIQFGSREGFVLQHAFSYAPGGPVHDAASRVLPRCRAPLVLRRWPEEASWNPKPALLRTLEGHSDAISAVTATPDLRRAVSASSTILSVWDLDSGQCERALELGDAISSVSMTPDGHRAVSATGTILWVLDLDSGQCERTLEHDDEVSSVSMTPDGRRAVSASGTNLWVWDLDSGQCERALELGNAVSIVELTPDGRQATSVCGEKLLVWDLENGRCKCFLKNSDPVKGVSVTPDGRRALSGSVDKTLRMWDLESGVCLHTLEGSGGIVSVMLSVESWRISMTPDGRRAVVGSIDEDTLTELSAPSQLRVWDMESGTCLRGLDGHNGWITSACVTADGRLAVSGSVDKTLRVWNLESGAHERLPEKHRDVVTSLTMTPDGRRAVSSSWDKTLRVWDLKSGTCLRMLEGHSRSIWSVSVTPDGRRALSGSDDQTVRVWDLESGDCLHTLQWPDAGIVAVTPDGRSVVSAGLDIRVWNVQTGQCEHTLEGNGEGIWSVSVTPDGRRAVSGSSDTTLRLWNLESGACLHTLHGHSDRVTSVSVTPDGRRAVSGSDDTTLRVWDLESGVCLHTLEGHHSTVASISVTPDGRHVVSGSWDRTVRVWDVESGACVAIFVATAAVGAVATFSRQIAIGTHTGQVLLLETRDLSNGPAITPETTHQDAGFHRGASLNPRSRRHKIFVGQLISLWNRCKTRTVAKPAYEAPGVSSAPPPKTPPKWSSLVDQANALYARGSLDDAMLLYKEGERLCRELDNKDGLWRSLVGQGNILYARGDLGGAMALYKEGERLCRELGNKEGLQGTLGNQAKILFDHGKLAGELGSGGCNLDGAMTLLKEQERLCRELGNNTALQATLSEQFLILCARGDLDDALAFSKKQARLAIPKDS